MHFCKHCEKGELHKVGSDEPWNPMYYACEDCDSTYTVDEIEDEEIEIEDSRDNEMSAYINVHSTGC